MTLRLSDDEFRALNAFVIEAGLPSRTAALRSLIRAATGFLELRRDEMLDLAEAKSELKAQGRNLNQIALAMNRAAMKGHAKLTNPDKEFLAGIKKTYAALDAKLSKAFREVRQKGRDALHSGEKL